MRRNKKNPWWITGGIVVLICIAVFASAKDRLNVSFIDNTVNVVSKPFVTAASKTEKFFTGFFDYFKNKKKLVKSVDELTYKNNYLEQKVNSLSSLEKENERLRDLLKLKDKYPEYKTVAASVIAKESGNYSRFITIDKGSESGIKVNKTVIAQDGLVGLVFEVGNGWSKIQTILDPTTSVGCKITRTGDISVCEGDVSLINRGLLKMLYISSGFTILEGDIVETSGLGEVYPKGIAIGRINEIKVEESTDSQYALISPIVDFSELYEVLVIVE